MSGDSDHPARKVSHQELIEFLAEKRDEVPALTTRAIASSFSEVEPSTISNNLKTLADEEKICRFNDGDIQLWWYPRESDSGGDLPYDEFVDDSVDYDDIEPSVVPQSLAREIASENLPHYRPQTLWSRISDMSQLALIGSLGVIVLGFGEIATSSFGLPSETAVLLLRFGVYASLGIAVIFLVASALHIISSGGYLGFEE